MAEKEAESVGEEESAEAEWIQSGPDSAGAGVLKEGQSLTPLDPNREAVVQPFPRSPKLQRKAASQPAQLSQEQLSRRMEELKTESSKTEAHIQSLKKRKADLSRTTDRMKQRVRENFENMLCVLQQDEKAVLDSLDLDLTRTRSRLDQVLENWEQHQDQVAKSIISTDTALNKKKLNGQSEAVSPKKPDASEKEIRLDGGRFEQLLRNLSAISKQLKAQLQRKTLLLDSSHIVIDKKTCHSQIQVTSEGRGMSFSGSARLGLEHPLQFDKVCCALSCSPLTTARGYWEVDVHCCAAWAVGVAYASLERKGRDKGAKLGRNRNSWCVEFRNGRLSGWHNNRHVVCQGVGQTPPRTIGVWLNYDKGQLLFYDADTMTVLQRFSAAVKSVFDRVHHQFTEPLYPALRFLKPAENQTWPNHVEFCQLSAP